MHKLLLKLKMKEKMILLAVSGIVLTAAVLCSVFYGVMHAAYKQKITQITKEAISQTSNYLNNELTHVLQLAHSGLVGYNVSEMVRRYGDELHNPLVYGQMQEMLTQFKIQNALIASAHMVYRGQKISNLNCRYSYDLDEVVEKALSHPMIYWGDTVVTDQNQNEQIIPLVLRIPYPTGQISAEYTDCVLVIDLSLNEIMKTLQQAEGGIYGEIMLLNQNGEAFVSAGNIEGEPILTQSADVAINGWKLQSVQKESVLLSEFYDAQNRVAALSLTLVIVFSVIASFFSKTITQPLIRLTKITEKLQVQDYSQTIPVDGCDEEAQLAQALNCLQQRLVEYQQIVEHDKQIIREEEAEKRSIEMRLLQSQINPHFLYNTMDAMYWYSIDRNSEKVSELILHLSSFFRLSLSKGSELVSVEHEVRHVETYLKIQKAVFANKFSYAVNLDPAVKEWKVMKILLQPLVENSILHGFADMEQGGEIEVNVCTRNGWLVMQVLDNGRGFDSDEQKGFALSNIRKRLLHRYGQNATFSLERTLMGMTKAEIKIKKEELE